MKDENLAVLPGGTIGSLAKQTVTRVHEKDTSTTYVNLDLARGLAAILVLVAHARAFALVPPSMLENPGVMSKLFYFVTGFGHEAVMVFFVLSGFFISRSIESMMQRDRWSWSTYLINRLSRLWIVLLPALLLTGVLDHIGIALGNASFYAGVDVAHYGSIPGDGTGGVDLSTANLLQNALFLVTVTTPTIYGTNGPLWSLTYEFWYYLMFPMACLVLSRHTLSLKGRVLQAALLVGCFLILPFGILFLSLVWLMGYAVLRLIRFPSVLQMARRPWFFGMALLGFVLAMSVSRVDLISGQRTAEVLVGLSFTVLMLSLCAQDLTWRWYRALAQFLSRISYSLYLVHFPMLAFFSAVFLDGQQLEMDAGGVGLFGFFCALSLAMAVLVYWLFERHHRQLAKAIRRRLPA